MQETPKAEEKNDSDDGAPRRSYYYDDAHGYEEYVDDETPTDAEGPEPVVPPARSKKDKLQARVLRKET